MALPSYTPDPTNPATPTDFVNAGHTGVELRAIKQQMLDNKQLASDELDAVAQFNDARADWFIQFIQYYINTSVAAINLLRQGKEGNAIGDIVYRSHDDLATIPNAAWLLCDGSTYDGTDPKYSRLFSVIGTMYGGSGSNFQVPDYRGFFLRVLDRGAGVDPEGLTRNIGDEQDDALQDHTHIFFTGKDESGGGRNPLWNYPQATPISVGNEGDSGGANRQTSSPVAAPTQSPDSEPNWLLTDAEETRPVNVAVDAYIYIGLPSWTPDAFDVPAPTFPLPPTP